MPSTLEGTSRRLVADTEEVNEDKLAHAEKLLEEARAIWPPSASSWTN